MSVYARFTHWLVCALFLNISSDDTRGKADSGSETAALRLERKKKRQQQCSLAVEPKSNSYSVSLVSVIKCPLERKWDICVDCKGNPRVSVICASLFRGFQYVLCF